MLSTGAPVCWWGCVAPASVKRAAQWKRALAEKPRVANQAQQSNHAALVALHNAVYYRSGMV